MTRQILIAILIICTACAAYAADASAERMLQQETAAGGGVACIARADLATAAIQAAENPRWMIHLLLPNQAAVAAAQAQAAATGRLGRNLYIDAWDGKRLPHADHLLDLLIAPEGLDKAEALRVLSPIIGQAYLGTERLKKPELPGSDWWTHRVHRADNNPVSKDTALQLPLALQYMAMPYYASYHGTLLIENGLRIELYDWILQHLNRDRLAGQMLCRNLYNGRVRWKRTLPVTMEPEAQVSVLQDGRLYLPGDEGCAVLVVDAATGADLDRIELPDRHNRRVTWIGVDQERLYALLSHWPRPESKGGMLAHAVYDRYVLSEGVDAGKGSLVFKELAEKAKSGPAPDSSIVCLDPAAGRILWRHEEDGTINHQNMALRDGRVYFYSENMALKNGLAYFCNDGRRLACLGPEGQLVWEDSSPDLLKELKQEKPWDNRNLQNMSTLVAGPHGRLLFQAGRGLYAFSAKTGKRLWANKREGNRPRIQRYSLSENMVKGYVSLHVETGEQLPRSQHAKRIGGHCGYRAWIPAFDAMVGHCSLGYKSPCAVPPVAAGGTLNYFPSVCSCPRLERGAAGFVSGKDLFERVESAAAHPLHMGDSYGKPGAPDLDIQDGDWPQYRGDGRHTGGVDRAAPKAVQLAAVLPLARPLPVPEGHFQFRWEWLDRSTPPVTAGGMAFYGLSTGLVRAVHIATGKEAWTYQTSGPIYGAPVVAGGRLCVGGGDGWVYCLDAASGQLAWRWRAAPIERRLPIYGRLASTWPVMTLVEADGLIVGTAGVQAINGYLTFALDAQTGAPHWQHWHENLRLGGLPDRRGLQGYPAYVGRDLGPEGYEHMRCIANLDTGLPPKAGDPPATLIAWPVSQHRDCIVPDEESILRGGGTLMENPDDRTFKYAVYYSLYSRDQFRDPKALPKHLWLASVRIWYALIPPAFQGEHYVRIGKNTYHKQVLSLWERSKLDDVQGPRRRGFDQHWKKHTVWALPNKVLNDMVLCTDAVLVTEALRGEPIGGGRPDPIKGWVLRAYHREDGRELWSLPLPCEPVYGGLAPAGDGSWVLTLRDGGLAIVSSGK